MTLSAVPFPLAFTLCSLVLATTLCGCDSKKEATITARPEAPVENSAQPAAREATTGHVSVSATGTKLEPPVDKQKIPDGAWICDMGTVHYASLEPGDGKCPVCGMDLVKKTGDTGAQGDHGSH